PLFGQGGRGDKYGYSYSLASPALWRAANTTETLLRIFPYTLIPPSPLGETRGAMVGVSGKVGRDRTPPLIESLIKEKEMLAEVDSLQQRE
ncbi:MAG: hypothetical protein WCB96_11070, partial [Candidatus Aminicenantales bacterium]